MPVYDCTSITKVFIMFTKRESGEGRRQRRGEDREIDEGGGERRGGEARERGEGERGGRGEREVRDETPTCTYLYRESHIHTLRHTDDDVIG